MRADIESFFQSYVAAYNGGDATAIARHISAPGLLIERTTTVWATDADVLAAMERLLAFYRANGFKRASCVLKRLVEQGTKHAVADVLWTIERTAGAAAWSFHTGYNLHRADGRWRIVACTAYEEMAARAG
ncbi:MAG: hypothetical protein NTV97_03330 [Alphaproteobacteria bacterium]|nr:hypothetical protein [Alphaproteobacteria bacterium]